GGASASVSAGGSSSSKSSSSGGTTESAASKIEWLNGVTPGTALSSSHTRGSKDTAAYGAADLDGDLGIDLEGGVYTSALNGNTLTLTGAGGHWAFDGAALRGLLKSGVYWVKLSDGTGEATLSTARTFTGPVYDALRAQGRTENTFAYTVTGGDVRVEVDGNGYRTERDATGALSLIPDGEG
ncbi:MAG: hypothetical protein IJ646_01820, partial [Clostridia bacterium]|nr:hypothetical protein [Clostridia bacterium]